MSKINIKQVNKQESGDSSNGKSNNSKPTKAKAPKYMWRFVRWMWMLVLLGLLLLAGIFVFISYTRLPDTVQLENPTFEYATIIYTADNVELGRAFRKNREWVSYSDLNKHLINGLIATEDERYHNHAGIDVRGTIRAMVFMGKKGGASTITQQLAKQLFTKRSRVLLKRIFQKFREWIIAVRIEKKYTKEEIIAMYLNKFDYRYDSDGVSAAAKTYFGKDQSKLKIEEAAMLVGMLKNPGFYNPNRYPERAKKRRSVVLNQMRKNKYITQVEYDSLKVIDLDMSNFKRVEDSKGLAPHFRVEMLKHVKSILKQDEYLKHDGTAYNVYLDGLRIYTTIDSKLQRNMEAAAKKNLARLQSKFWNRWKSTDPWTYKADKAQKEARNSSLNRLIRSSDRYQRIKKKYMEGVIAQAESSFPEMKFRDVDIIRMMKESKRPGYFNTLLNKRYATKEQVEQYRDLMKSNHWENIRKNWVGMEKEVRKKFNEKQNMEVFAYNRAGKKDTLMSPLDSVKYHRMHLQTGMLGIEPSTGHVKAWVGGADHNYFQYDHVTSNRQVGSTFKPFIYGTAIFQQHISPCWKVVDMQYSIPARDSDFGLMKTWSPANANGKFTGKEMTLYEGLKQSKNSVSVWLMKELGNVEVVKDLAANMGISRDKIPSSPSICLGTPELSLLEMTSAYTTFANDGIHIEPIYIDRIENREGDIIYKGVADQKRALPSDYNYVMVDMLREAAAVITPKFETQVGGKTGTTDDYVDGWFMGITPNLVVGTWVGGEDPWIRFKNIQDGQGGAMARPAFVDFLQALELDPNSGFYKGATFNVPDKMDIEIDCKAYLKKEEAFEGASENEDLQPKKNKKSVFDEDI